MQWLRFHYPIGPLVSRINRELENRGESFRPDVVWFDKPACSRRKPWMPSIRLARKSSSTYRTRHSDRAKTGAGGSFRGSTGWPTSIAWLGKLTLLVIATGDFRGLKPCSVLIRASISPRIPDSAMQTVIAGLLHRASRTSSARNSCSGSRSEYQLPVFINGNRWTRSLTPEEQQFFTLGNFYCERTISLGHLEIEDQPQLRNRKQRR